MLKSFIITDDMVETVRFTLAGICGFEITAQTARKALESAHRVAPVTAGQCVEVKRLEWLKVLGWEKEEAETPFGDYTLWASGALSFRNESLREAGDTLAAKAWAQADYEQRILSALATPTPKEESK